MGLFPSLFADCSMSQLDRSSQWAGPTGVGQTSGRRAQGDISITQSCRPVPQVRTQVLADKEPASVGNHAAKTIRKEARMVCQHPEGEVEAAARRESTLRCQPVVGGDRDRPPTRKGVDETELIPGVQPPNLLAKITPKYVGGF